MTNFLPRSDCIRNALWVVSKHSGHSLFSVCLGTTKDTHAGRSLSSVMTLLLPLANIFRACINVFSVVCKAYSQKFRKITSGCALNRWKIGEKTWKCKPFLLLVRWLEEHQQFLICYSFTGKCVEHHVNNWTFPNATKHKSEVKLKAKYIPWQSTIDSRQRIHVLISRKGTKQYDPKRSTK